MSRDWRWCAWRLLQLTMHKMLNDLFKRLRTCYQEHKLVIVYNEWLPSVTMVSPIGGHHLPYFLHFCIMILSNQIIMYTSLHVCWHMTWPHHPRYTQHTTLFTSQDKITLVIPNCLVRVKLLWAEQIIACCEQHSINCCCTIASVMTSSCSGGNI